jgi:hypothetical protein
MVNKAIFYVISVIGLIVIAAGVMKDKIAFLGFLSGVKPIIIMFAGAIITIAGLVPLMGKGDKVEQAAEEVPIYQGKKIVGYRKENK